MLKEDKLGQATHFDYKYVWHAMLDYKTYVQIAIYMGMIPLRSMYRCLHLTHFAGLLVPVYAVALFTPTIVNELGTCGSPRTPRG